MPSKSAKAWRKSSLPAAKRKQAAKLAKTKKPKPTETAARFRSQGEFPLRRQKLQEKLIGKLVEVRALDGKNPQKVPNCDVYVPLPEYGAALWRYKETPPALLDSVSAKANTLSKTVSMPLLLAIKLGKLIVHTDEMLGAGGHHFDRGEILNLLRDDEVRAWVKEMGALLPHKRSPGLLDGVEPDETSTPQVDLTQVEWLKHYRDVSIVQHEIDSEDEEETQERSYAYDLKYTPTCAGGKPQTMRLDAEDEINARHEAAHHLGHGCQPEALVGHMQYE